MNGRTTLNTCDENKIVRKDDWSEAPIITVLMPVFNAEQFLAVAVESIRKQTYPAFELLAVNDGSTDRSLEILQDLANQDNRIRIISRPNTGLVGALQDGLSCARGSYIARMDADDVSSSNRLELQFAFLETNLDVAGVSGAMRYIDEYGNPIYEKYPPLFPSDIERDLREGIGESFLHGASMVRKEAIKSVGGYRREFEYAEDVDLFLRICGTGRLANLDSILLEYRMHQSSICHRHAELQRSRLNTLIGDKSTKVSRSDQTSEESREYFFYINIALEALISNNLRTSRVNAIRSLRVNPFSWRAIVILIASTNRWFAYALRRQIRA